MKTQLQLVFVTAQGKSVTVAIDDPKPNVTSDDVKRVMDEVIAANALVADDVLVQTKKQAKLVTKEETPLFTA